MNEYKKLLIALDTLKQAKRYKREQTSEDLFEVLNVITQLMLELDNIKSAARQQREFKMGKLHIKLDFNGMR